MTFSSQQFCDTCGAANRPQASFCKVCGNPLQPVVSNTTITISSTLTGLLAQRTMLKQRYMILQQVGKGGFGAVYKAMDTFFGNRVVAIKEMSQSSLESGDLKNAVEDFQREAMLLSSLTHPNLPRIYDQFNDLGRSYLVMDFIDGRTLEEHLNRQPSYKIPVEQVVDLGLQLCAVLDYLHTRQPPIVFRDLKPANIMLTGNQQVYLIDFGIARHFKPGQQQDTTALGSSGYAAPEQYGKSQTTPRADIYSLGVTLHQALSGDDPTETPFHFAPLPPTPLSGLDKLIMSMISVEVGKRPATATEVRQQLQQMLTRHTTNQIYALPSHVPSAQPTPSIPAIKNKPTRPSPVVQPIPQLNTLYICCGHTSRVSAVAWSPDGKLLASGSYDKTIQIWDATSGSNILTYRGHHKRINALAWSPDSTQIASASDDGTIQIWEATTQKLLYTYNGHIGPVRAVAWTSSSDKTRIASAGDDKVVHVWTRDAGNLFTFKGHNNRIHTLSWSPDGKYLASAGKDFKIHIWDPSKSQQKRSLFSTLISSFSSPDHRTLDGHYGPINGLAWSLDGYLASASTDHGVLIRQMPTGQIVLTLGNNNSGIKNSVAWSPASKGPSSRYLAIACNNRTVQVWNTTTQKLTFTYHGHASYVMAVAWSPDGTRIASAGVDRTVQVWQAV